MTGAPSSIGTQAATGYLHRDFADSLSQFGQPHLLPRSGGWILDRSIAGTSAQDAMGCYPLFACQDWSQLAEDLEVTHESLVSLALVADPFGNYTLADLQHCFPDRLIPFKQHCVIELVASWQDGVSSHHRRNIDKAHRQVTVERCEVPGLHVEEWIRLYGNLVRRHGITGLTAFSRETFEKQFCVPGLVVFRAVMQGETVGMLLWMVHGDVAYYHLGAYDDRGYEAGASFALFSRAIECFFGQLRWLNLGAGAGTGGQVSGLARFKAGWSKLTRTAYFCGRILNRQRYAELVNAKGGPETAYFPAYRAGEFG